VILLALYSGLLYGLYVPDWQFDISASTSSLPPIGGGVVYTVRVDPAPFTSQLLYLLFASFFCLEFDFMNSYQILLVR